MFPTPKTVGLEFEIKDHVVLFREIENLLESRNALTHELARKPGTGVEPADFGQCQLMDGTLTIGGAIDGFVVDGDEVSVASQVQVGFDKSGALRDRAAKSGQRIFRGVAGCASV